MGRLADLIKENELAIRNTVRIGHAKWDDLVSKVEKQEASRTDDFYDEQIWTFLVGCAYALAANGADLLSSKLIGSETSSTVSTNIWFESVPNSPRVKEGGSRIDLAVGAIKLRHGTKSGIEFDPTAGDWIGLCECKWYSDIDTKVSYDQHRNQLLRTIENALFFQDFRTFPKHAHVVLVTPSAFKYRSIKSRLYHYKFEEYKCKPQTIIDELDACCLKRADSYPANLKESLNRLKLHWVTYQDLLEQAPESIILESLKNFVNFSDGSNKHR